MRERQARATGLATTASTVALVVYRGGAPSPRLAGFRFPLKELRRETRQDLAPRGLSGPAYPFTLRSRDYKILAKGSLRAFHDHI